MEKVIVNISWHNNYGAVSDDVLGCVATDDTIEGVKQAYKEALELHIEGYIEDGEELPSKLQGEYELVFELSTSALLHSLDGIVTRKAIARATGINETQLTHYASGIRKPRPLQRQKIVVGIHHLGKELMNIE